ncbi:hypothetical protein HU200_028399 [Digitaria exilis]|uniref:At1g61320/AtMIF1 LRR domain-containing protein n=1 Tax=Digitaria exilis TaxID=1010633 RepID=A0A835BV71_9POAL|nr:hypothetical protein HU200_028399 [Digitaria exilis]
MQDIWCHIHSLMPIDAAARAACLSRTFLSSWRCYPKLDLGCYPKLTLTRRALCPKTYGADLSLRIGSILRNHSGTGIEELTLFLYEDEEYIFPISLPSLGVRSSIRSLELRSCVFRPTPELGPLRGLTRLALRDVRITGLKLECLLSNSLALELLDLIHCHRIIFLKIPSVLLQLSCVKVRGCSYLRAVQNKAPNLSSFTLYGQVSKLSLGATLPMMKVFVMRCDKVIRYARANLPPIMPNLETLELGSTFEVNTPMLPSKFLNLKHLIIQVNGETLSPSYDYFSLISFLDASPSLETWWLDHESVFEGSSHLRQLPECHHDRLKSFEVIGFSSAKGLVELTCCIVKSAVSLERLRLDTLCGDIRCSDGNDSDSWDICEPISEALLEEAIRGVAAIRKYIEDKVPPTANLIVLEPCPRCHTTTVDHGW